MDPGLRITGYAVLEGENLIKWGFFKPEKKGNRRYEEIAARIGEVVDRYSPDICGMETVFFRGRGVDSIIKMAELRGAILSVLGAKGVKILDFPPAFVKKTITGNGRASKQQVKFMVSRIFGIDYNLLSVDEADAIAIAYCTLKYAGNNRR